jgi:ABC-type lipoprotein export system ATPase subunit
LLEENFLVQLILSQNKISVLERKKVIDDLLEDLNLTHLKQSHLDKFSGGELQRAAIGMAIISRPLILLLDEATAMLDSASVANINEIIGKLNKKYNTLIIFATHDESLISHENVIKLYNGRISSSAK